MSGTRGRPDADALWSLPHVHTLLPVIRRLPSALFARPSARCVFSAVVPRSSARCYIAQKKLSEARTEFEALARRQAKPVPALTMSGMILMAQGQTELATKRYQDVLAIDPRRGDSLERSRLDPCRGR